MAAHRPAAPETTERAGYVGLGLGRSPEDPTGGALAGDRATGATQVADTPSLAGEIVRDCDACPELVVPPAGTFTLGAAADDAESAERPARVRHVWPGFAIGRTEITVAEYQRFVAASGHRQPSCASRVADASGATPRGRAPTPFMTNRHPVVCVDWRDARACTVWLSGVTGKSFRLASAAEWEYAARPSAAGIVRAVPAGPVAAPAVQPVATSPANAWGIHDLGGNVAELVADCWHDGIDRGTGGMRAHQPRLGCARGMLKDGAAGEEPRWQRASARRPIDLDARSLSIGFRVARDLERGR